MEKPTFTIFVPAYNGGDYLRQCVGSMLAQRYDGYELAILDDGSSDGSLEWLAGLGEERIKLYPSRHLGIVENWRRTLQVPKLDYLTIAGQDDLFDPGYLATMAELIRREPQAGLYHANFRFIDKAGKLIRPCGALPERETAAEYIRALYTDTRDTYGTGYLMSSARYDAAGGIPPFEKLLFADDALWIAAMRGAYKGNREDRVLFVPIAQQQHRSVRALGIVAERDAEYIPFLKTVARQDEEFARALETCGPPYFTRYCQNLYRLANVQATKSNRRIEPDVVDRLAAVLGEIAPEKVPELCAFASTKGYRMRQFINSTAITRFSYNLFIWAKHGEWKGKRVR